MRVVLAAFQDSLWPVASQPRKRADTMSAGRYEVDVTMTLIHHMAIEAESAPDAMAKALIVMADRDPEELSTDFKVERGAM